MPAPDEHDADVLRSGLGWESRGHAQVRSLMKVFSEAGWFMSGSRAASPGLPDVSVAPKVPMSATNSKI